MIFYLTFNDGPSGIFSSQVIDVVKFIRDDLKKNIKLVSLVSLRGFFHSRKKIKSELPEAIVIPMFPGVHRWRKNKYFLAIICSRFKPSIIIGRSVLATQIAFDLKRHGKTTKVIYDGRGAISAEWNEYEVVKHPVLIHEISQLEKDAVLDSDFRIAVSNQLIEYWKTQYNYSSTKHVVIPCTLNKVFEEYIPDENNQYKLKRELGFEKGDIVFAYSGSLAGWQSFHLLADFIEPVLKSNDNARLLFLSEKDKNIIDLEKKFPGKVYCKKVSPSEVPAYLSIADYGLLIREKSITNRVASPVKFAEYLACGLPVIISEELGDYSEFVNENKCGYLSGQTMRLKPLTFDEKLTIRKMALLKFTKQSFCAKYEMVIEKAKSIVLTNLKRTGNNE
ncbi:MAG: glycosyltransferase [Bacteroidia bacterium]